MRAVVMVIALLVVVACSGPGNADPTATVDWSDWDAVLDAADGETVRLWMWGGDDVLNRYIDTTVARALEPHGVTIRQVRLDATSDAVDQIVAEAEAGARPGSVDLVWINGQNFAQVKAAGLWAEDWLGDLPNAALLDPADPTLREDFGVPTDGQAAPWSRAAFVFAYDTDRTDAPPMSFEQLEDWVAANPGRFTYPAPPDFTGSAFVRQAVQSLGEEEAFAYLRRLEPDLWSGGSRYPRDEAELNRLFADSQVDLTMSYNPNVVAVNVREGEFPSTVRPFTFADGTLQNVSFLAMPAAAPAPAAARVVVNELLSADLQREKLDLVGAPPVVEVENSTGGPYRLASFGDPLEELDAERVVDIDRRWRQRFSG